MIIYRIAKQIHELIMRFAGKPHTSSINISFQSPSTRYTRPLSTKGDAAFNLVSLLSFGEEVATTLKLVVSRNWSITKDHLLSVQSLPYYHFHIHCHAHKKEENGTIQETSYSPSFHTQYIYHSQSCKNQVYQSDRCLFFRISRIDKEDYRLIFTFFLKVKSRNMTKPRFLDNITPFNGGMLLV